MAPPLGYPKTKKKLSASGGFSPLTARPGALPKNVSTILQDCAIARIGSHLLLNRASPKLHEKKSTDDTISACKNEEKQAISRLIFGKYWGGATAPLPRPHPLGAPALRASAPRSGPSVPPSSSVHPAPNLPLHHWLQLKIGQNGGHNKFQDGGHQGARICWGYFFPAPLG